MQYLSPIEWTEEKIQSLLRLPAVSGGKGLLAQTVSDPQIALTVSSALSASLQDIEGCDGQQRGPMQAHQP